MLGGYFDRVGNQYRLSIAAVPQALPLPDAMFSDSFE